MGIAKACLWRDAGQSPALTLLLLLAGAARAPPPLAPTRDVSVTYRLETLDLGTPGGMAISEFRLRALAGGMEIRLDRGASGGYLLIDTKAQTATLVGPKIRANLTVALNPEVARGPFLLNPAVPYQETDSATIDGLACDLWMIGTGGDEGLARVTSDGVIRRRVGAGDPAHRAPVTTESVSYAPEPAALFALPAGFQDLSAVKAPLPQGGKSR